MSAAAGEHGPAAQRAPGARTAWRGPVLLGDLDGVLVLVALALLALGTVMVASASMTVAARAFDSPWFYFNRQIVFVALGIGLAWLAVQVPLARWRELAMPLMLVGVLLLALVLMPGLGRTVKGSTRWLELGVIGFQVAEAVKLATIVYIADYLVRRHAEIRASWSGFLRPLALVGVAGLLLLLQPDFGAAVVLGAVALAMLFLGGVPMVRFCALGGAAVALLTMLAITTPYRLQRITTFLDPWADPFDSGFQLTQSLMAIGSGGWNGVGLGASVQKLFYLPEAHTDFLFAIFAEETGLIGVMIVLALYVLLIGRAFQLTARAERADAPFAAHLAAGLGLWIALQAVINIGVNMGLLPTKGLTLPLMSYGGSSTLMTCIAIGLLLRVSYEINAAARQASRREMVR